jgi:transcriptional regulator with XRE-family HTH domain
MTISMKEMRARLNRNPDYRAEYDGLAPEFEIAAELIRARTKADLSQVEVASRIGTTQSEVARMESGRAALKTTTIYRYAHALGLEPQIKLVRKKAALQPVEPRSRSTRRRPSQATSQR